MFVCCECCALSGRGLCDGLITRPGGSTDCGASTKNAQTSQNKQVEPWATPEATIPLTN
jgi:hypothetical protein